MKGEWKPSSPDREGKISGRRIFGSAARRLYKAAAHSSHMAKMACYVKKLFRMYHMEAGDHETTTDLSRRGLPRMQLTPGSRHHCSPSLDLAARGSFQWIPAELRLKMRQPSRWIDPTPEGVSGISNAGVKTVSGQGRHLTGRRRASVRGKQPGRALCHGAEWRISLLRPRKQIYKGLPSEFTDVQ